MPPRRSERCEPGVEPASWRDRIDKVVARYARPSPGRDEREDELRARGCDPELLIRKREPDE